MTMLLKNKRNTTNVYATMLSDIKDNISSGDLKSGDRLPSEKELGVAYGISINSVRRGIDELKKEGIIKSRRGSGMFVAVPEKRPDRDQCLDTIALLFDTYIQGYHPFFSELRKGVNESLIQKGWRLWFPDEGLSDTGQGDQIMHHDLRRRVMQFHGKGDFAGAAMSPDHAKEISKQICYDLPIVLPTYSEQFPFVAYNWDDELVQLTRSVIRKGARRILFVFADARNNFDNIVKRAAIAEDRRPLPSFSTLKLPAMSNYFLLSKEAFNATDAYLRSKQPFDAVVVDSDFAVQGVMDAFISQQWQREEAPFFSLIKNRFFELNTPYRYSASVIDGYVQGIKMGNLLHERITSPETAPNNIWLHGDMSEQ